MDGDAATGHQIAIVGMAGRFPRSPDLATFWRHLRDGVELIRFFSDEELLARGVDPALIRSPSFVKAASALEGIEEFDADFFGFLPRQAEVMDPQHRLLLECSWEALEDAGYDPDRIRGLTGLFAGAAMNGYLIFHLVGNPAVTAAGFVPLQLANDKDYMPSRIAYKLDLRGPAYLVQSACSTSLVAIHVACQSLLSGECDLALAGGVAGLVHNRDGYEHTEGGIFSPDGHCRSFDAAGRGTIFGSGAGLVVLKRLEDAVADGDTIRAVILGSAVNNDGAIKAGYTAPSVAGQAEVIAEALAHAGVGADSISYVEGHGTATQLGDPIEIQALTKAFRASTDKSRFCALGSVKSNLGHLDAAAGVTGVIKTVLALQHRQLPPSLHFETPNPGVDWAHSPFVVNTRLTDWPASGGPRRAGVSSFGIGGTNAHLILEEATPTAAPSASLSAQLLVLSARTTTALDRMSARLADHLEQQPELELADVAGTLQLGRRCFGERRALVCHDREDAVAGLRGRQPLRLLTATQEQRDRPVVFLFPGQGSQHVHMARGLYDELPLFRKLVDECAGKLVPALGLDLRALLFADDAVDAAGRQLQETRLAQPALFVVEYALAKLWMSWGLKPRAMIGHSLGEYVAACLAGVWSLDDALALVAARGRLMGALPSGAMLAVSLPAVEVRAALPPSLSLAAINGPGDCVVSGPTEAIDAWARELGERRGARCRRLAVSHAFHSSLMEPILQPFGELLRRMRFTAPTMPWVSNLTGTVISAAEATSPDYWLAHLRQPVSFAAGIDELLAAPNQVLLEVGPGQTLASLARKQSRFGEQLVLSSARHPREATSDVAYLMETVARLWLGGVTIDWARLHGPSRRRRVPLPTYPFERKRHWVEPVSSAWRAQPTRTPAAGGASATTATAAAATTTTPTTAAPPPPPAAALTAETPAAATPTAPSSAMTALLNEQLRVLSLQLDVIRQGNRKHEGSSR